MREEKSLSQRAFSIYTDIRKLQDKAKTSYTLSTRRLRFGYTLKNLLSLNDDERLLAEVRTYQEKLISNAEEPIWERKWLTIEEAAAYSGIGRTKLRELSNQAGCPFAIWIGNKIHIVRERLDKYIDKQFRI